MTSTNAVIVSHLFDVDGQVVWSWAGDETVSDAVGRCLDRIQVPVPPSTSYVVIVTTRTVWETWRDGPRTGLPVLGEVVAFGGTMRNAQLADRKLT